MRYHSIKQIVSLCVLGAAVVWPSVGRAQYNYQLTTSDPNLPPPSGVYLSPDQWHARYLAYGVPIYLLELRHYGFTTNSPPPPPGPVVTHSFGSTISGLVSTDGGVTSSPFSASAQFTVDIQFSSLAADGISTNFTTEITALSATLPNGAMIRESPTLASVGQTRTSNYGGGVYCVSSYFDVYTEISLNGINGPWFADLEGPVRMELIPEPSSFMLAALGLVGLFAYVRRSRK